MIKALAGDITFLGLTEENLRRLRQGEPIMFSNWWAGKEGKTVILYRENEQTITDQLAQIGKFPEVPEETKS